MLLLTLIVPKLNKFSWVVSFALAGWSSALLHLFVVHLGRPGCWLVVAVLASGEHPKPQPSLDVTFCGLGTWRIDNCPITDWSTRHQHYLDWWSWRSVKRLTRYISPNHRNAIVFVNWYLQCLLLLPQSDLVELCTVLVEEKCSSSKWKKYPSLCFATCCGCFDSLIPIPALRQAKPNYSQLNQQLKNIIPENFPILLNIFQ